MKRLVCCIGLVLISAAWSSESHYDIPRAYSVISHRYGVPAEVFFSVALQESGYTKDGKYLPWPWTLNIDNKGYFFEDRESAEKALIDAMSGIEKSKVAVGIGQIYMPSHEQHFASPLIALDPTINLNYAARLIALEYVWTVKQGKPDWWVAVGRYHTPSNNVMATTYREQVYRRCAKVSDRCSLFGRSMATLDNERQ